MFFFLGGDEIDVTSLIPSQHYLLIVISTGTLKISSSCFSGTAACDKVRGQRLAVRPRDLNDWLPGLVTSTTGCQAS